MIESVTFSLFQRRTDVRGGRGHDLPPDVFAECVRRWPEFKKPGKASFSVEAPKNSPILHEILLLLEEHGFTANWKRFPSVEYGEANRFQLEGRREFSSEEIAKADYLWCIPDDEISKDGYRHDNGTIEVKRGGILKKDFGSTATGFNLLCTDTCRRAMESEAFTNLNFREVSVTGKKPPVEDIWEVVGAVDLPPVGNPLVDQDGNDPDRSKSGCWIDDLYFPPVPLFLRSAVVTALPDFDIALTSERWHAGPFERRSAYAICSQRFRSWVLARKYHCRFVPVTLED